MVVRFYGKENMPSGDNATSSTRIHAQCNTDSVRSSSATTTTSGINATPIATSLNNGNHMNFQKSGSLREIVGNCKEVRIEENSHNLRIVGNNNRIRITVNVGDITIIGNNTRLKIKINHGVIKYTGNDGRIILGKESTEQLVDYSGCNGVLKVQSSQKTSQANANDDADEMINNSTTGSTYFNRKLNASKKPKKYASSPTISEVVFKCHNNCDRKRSMPNITTTTTNASCHSDNVASNRVQQPLPKSIVPNFGNIVIANSSNVYISPYAYTY